jgi:hypothetical protein
MAGLSIPHGKGTRTGTGPDNQWRKMKNAHSRIYPVYFRGNEKMKRPQIIRIMAKERSLDL